MLRWIMAKANFIFSNNRLAVLKGDYFPFSIETYTSIYKAVRYTNFEAASNTVRNVYIIYTRISK